MRPHHQSDNSQLLIGEQVRFYNHIVQVITPVKFGLAVLIASVLTFCAALSVAFF